MDHFGNTLRATYVSAPIARQALPKEIPPKVVEDESKFWKSPFPKLSDEELISWKPQMEDLALKPNKNRPICKYDKDEMIGSGLQLKSLDAFLVPDCYRSVRNPLHTRYTTNEWQSWNNTSYRTSRTMCGDSDRMMKNDFEMCNEIVKKVDRAEDVARQALANRLLELHLKKTEVNNEQKALIDEIDELTKLNTLVDELLTKLDSCLQISENCVYERDKRQSMELCHDTVEKALVCEVDTIRNCKSKFQDSAEKILAQQSKNRSALHEIEMDTIDKERTLQLDEAALLTSKADPAIINSGYKDLELIENSITDQRTWLESATATIERCQNQRTPSKTLRDSLETLIDDICDRVLTIWNMTNKAISERIDETLDAKTKMIRELDCVNHKIFNLQRTMDDIRIAMTDNHATHQRQQRRLDLRYRRPNVECSRDVAQDKLIEEGAVIKGAMEDLKKSLYEAGDQMHLLQKMRTSLEEDIAVKDNTLFIDREKVRPLRKNFPLLSLCGIRIKVEPDISTTLTA